MRNSPVGLFVGSALGEYDGNAIFLFFILESTNMTMHDRTVEKHIKHIIPLKIRSIRILIKHIFDIASLLKLKYTFKQANILKFPIKTLSFKHHITPI